MTDLTVVEENPIGLEVHGLGGNLMWDEDGLTPYWGLVNAFEPDHDERLDTFEAVGETWEITGSSHWEGKLAPPPGTDFDGGLYEYQYQLRAVDDWGDKDATFQFRPGFPDAMHVDSGDPIQSMPDDCPESIRVQSITTNLDPAEAETLLRALADHVGLNPDYFAGRPTDWASAYQIELYARLDRQVAEDHLTGSGGILDQIADFGSDQRGRGEYKWDHEEIEGHYQSVAIDPDTWSLLLDGHEYGKHLKVYHPSHPRHEATSAEDDPLVDPKIEISFSPDCDPDDNVAWSDLDDVLHELEEAALNGLHWAGVPIEADAEQWTREDPYFDVEPSHREIALTSNPLPDLREVTERHVESELVRAEVTKTDEELLSVLTDGGAQHYETLADDAEASTSSVYRFIHRFAGVLDSENGIVQFADEVTRGTVTEIVDQVRQTAEWGSEAIRDVVDRDSSFRSSDGTSALEQWMQRHGIKLVEDRADRLRLKLGRPVAERELMKMLRSGLEAAEASSILTSRFENALLDWTDMDGNPRKGWQIVVDGRILRKGGGLEAEVSSA